MIRGVATLYDPVGYYAPLNKKGKILLQDLSKENLSLDQVLPTQFTDRWLEIATSITNAVDSRIIHASLSIPEAELMAKRPRDAPKFLPPSTLLLFLTDLWPYFQNVFFRKFISSPLI